MLQPNRPIEPIDDQTTQPSTKGWAQEVEKDTTQGVEWALQETPIDHEFIALIETGKDEEVFGLLKTLNITKSFHVFWKSSFLRFLDFTLKFKEDAIFFDRFCIWFLQLFKWLDDEVVSRILSIEEYKNQKEFFAKRILMNIESFDKINIKPLIELYNIADKIHDPAESKYAAAIMQKLNAAKYSLEEL